MKTQQQRQPTELFVPNSSELPAECFACTAAIDDDAANNNCAAMANRNFAGCPSDDEAGNAAGMQTDSEDGGCSDDDSDDDECSLGENDEHRETLETLLRHCERSAALRLDAVACEPGSRLGDNYMSVVKRVHVRGHFDNGNAYSRTLIVKRPILRRSRRRLFRCDQAFGNEIAAFSRLLPELEAFAARPHQLPLARCLFAGQDAFGALIALDDLRAEHFRMVDRLQGLDVQHCRLVMQKLGTLHGVSVAMRTAQPERFRRVRQQVAEIVYCPEAAAFYAASLNSSVHEALSSLRQTRRRRTDGLSETAIECVERLAGGRMYELMAAAVRATADDERWQVMCHGDLWVNNLMFRYDDGGCGQPSDVRLLDLQAARCASPAIDLLHFLYTSTERSVRQPHLNELLAVYSEALLCETDRYAMDSAKRTELRRQFSVRSVRQELRTKIMYGLGISMWLLPAVTFHPDRIPDLNTLTMSDFDGPNDGAETIIIQMQTPEYHARIRDVVEEFYEAGYFEPST